MKVISSDERVVKIKYTDVYSFCSFCGVEFARIKETDLVCSTECHNCMLDCLQNGSYADN